MGRGWVCGFAIDPCHLKRSRIDRRACVSSRKQRHGCCLQRSIVKLQQAIEPGAARPVKGAFERLEPRAGKLACGVLRGLGGSNAPWLPDQPTPPLAAAKARTLSESSVWRRGFGQ